VHDRGIQFHHSVFIRQSTQSDDDILKGLFLEIHLLNWNVHILQKLKSTSSSIGKIVFENSYQVAVSIVYKLAIDKKHSLTLKKFRDLVRCNLVFAQHKKELDFRLKKFDFDGKIKKIQSMFTDERHEVIAHFSSGKSGTYFITSEKKERREEILKKIKKSCKFINQLYNILRLKGYSTREISSLITTNRQANKILNQLNEIERFETINELFSRNSRQL